MKDLSEEITFELTQMIKDPGFRDAEHSRERKGQMKRP